MALSVLWTFGLLARIGGSFQPPQQYYSHFRQHGKRRRLLVVPTAALHAVKGTGTRPQLQTNDSLSGSVSSPEKYAKALGLSLQEVEEAIALREQAVQELQIQIARESDGRQRHKLICQHRFQHGKHPFVCKKCWSYHPICLCHEVPREKTKIPCHKVVIWTHHSEWGSPSNTGSMLPLLLENTQILMKGLHDKELGDIVCGNDDNDNYNDSMVQPVVLWPNVNKHDKMEEETIETVTLDELAGKTNNIVLLAVEGTWRQARRMVSKLPYPRLSLDEKRPTPSLLSPLRSQTNGPAQSVCTAEAVVHALQGLGMEADPAILHTVRLKVDRTRRYQGKANRTRPSDIDH